MSAATELMAEAEADADWRNAEVIQAAYRARGLRCGDCDYPQNAGVFEQLLFDYEAAKIGLHFHQVRYDPPYWSYHEGGSDYHLRMVHYYQGSVRTLRDDLTRMWPCQNCMKRFNPTRRTRRIWKFIPIRFPANDAKEFLDD